jgi:hypothetical protein
VGPGRPYRYRRPLDRAGHQSTLSQVRRDV